MDQDIRYTEYRIRLILTDHHIHQSSICFCNHTVNGQGQGHPLIFLDTAIVMGIQIGQITFLIERILLYIQPGRIQMGTQDIHTLFQRILADVEQSNRLSHIVGIDLVSRCKLLLTLHGFLQRDISRLLRLLDHITGSLPLRLAQEEVFLISVTEFLQFL